MESKNMTIWDAVEKTDPDYTKDFKKGGGFEGTAINPTYLFKKATNLWGAIGKGWGYNIVDEKYINGAPIFGENGNVLCHEIIHVIRLELWFMDGEEKVVCPPQFGQTTFVGHNKYGVFTDEEAPKKTVTDAVSKCLSALGFSADIYMGKYDDSKQVNDAAGKKESHAPVQKKAGVGKLEELLTRAELAGNKTDFDIKFVADFKDKFKQYGERTKVSEKQLAVLQKIADKAPNMVRQQEDDMPVPPAYLNDEIPY